MSTHEILIFATRQANIYFGLSIMISGVIGGIFNIIIFTTLKTFRETTCAFYLTAVSVVNIIQLLIALFVRVLSDGFSTDIRRTSWVCKIQIYISVWCNLVSTTYVCLATIDQFLSMSHYRRFSNLRFAQRCIFITGIFWGLYSTCSLIYWDAPFGICMIINSNFAMYVNRFQLPILYGALPLTTMITFSLLAFYNARTLISRQINIVRLSRDRQLTVMTLVHVVFVTITTLPYIIYFIYSLNQTTNEREQIARNNLIYTILVLILYSSYAGSFYIYSCVSKRFRQQLFFVISNACIKQYQQWTNKRAIAISLLAYYIYHSKKYEVSLISILDTTIGAITISNGDDNNDQLTDGFTTKTSSTNKNVQTSTSTQSVFWNIDKPLNTARSSFGSALLANGQVLIAGGQITPTTATQGTEVYSSTGWQLVPSMTFSHAYHTVTAVANNTKVLAAGSTTPHG
ncbi:unnamed protein product [Adineta steineri]|uniref:G-protein coupled receptors family 1 profile domain-containing protein n=1 Tax=Adineta steineri TaxID=433720 RepID=A0A813RBF7_9BILA|nr:unnamed protein product [Adineta steineri]